MDGTHASPVARPSASRRVALVVSGAAPPGPYARRGAVLRAMRPSTRYDVRGVEGGSMVDLAAAVARHDPAVVIFDTDALALPWARTAAALACDRPTAAVLQDAGDLDAAAGPFDLLLVHEPRLEAADPAVVACPRLVDWPEDELPERPAPPARGPARIGSFGVPGRDGHFEAVVDFAQASFDRCLVRLHLLAEAPGEPPPWPASAIVENCLARVRRPGLILQATHAFTTREQLVADLAANDLNVLLDDSGRDHGRAVDAALASGRPLALRRGRTSRWFDGLADASIVVEDRPLGEILRDGTAPLRAVRAAWSAERARECYERALDALLARHPGSRHPATRRAESGRGDPSLSGGLLLVAPASRDEVEPLRASLAAGTGRPVAVVRVRCASELALRVAESGAGLVVVLWSRGECGWLDWLAAARLDRPIAVLAGPGEAVPLDLPAAMVLRRDEPAPGMPEPAIPLAALLAAGRGAFALEAAAAHVAARLIDADPLASSGEGFAIAAARHAEATARCGMLRGAVPLLREREATWRSRADSLHRTLVDTIAERDRWRRIAERATVAPPQPAAGEDAVTTADASRRDA